MANRSFSVQLEDIPNPQDYGRAGAALERAGAYRGEAARIGAAADAGALATVFGVGLEAVKGYGEAQVAKETKEAVARFEDSPENVKGREAAGAIDTYDAARLSPVEQEQRGVIVEAASNEHPAVAELRAEANRFRLAESQGLLTRDEVLTRTAKAVKTWSARLPGFQSDFRKAAANETGISNIDVYQLHQALTTESQREATAKRAALAEQKYIEEVAQYHGIPPSAVTQTDAQRFFAHKQLAAQTANVENEAKVAAANATTKGKALDSVLQLQQSKDVLTLSAKFSNWDKANADPTLSKQRDAIATDINASLSQMKLSTMSYIQRQSAVLGIDAAPRIAALKTTYDEYENLLKTKGGFDAMRVVIGRREDDVKDMMNRFELANPLLARMGRMGIADDMFNLYMDKGKDALIPKVGKEAAEAYDKFFKNPNQWINGWDRAVNPDIGKRHGPVNFHGADAAHYDAPQRELNIAEWKQFMQRAAVVADMTPQENEQSKFAMLNMATNVRATETNLLKEYVDSHNQPGMDAYISSIPVVERKMMAEPVFQALAEPTRRSVSNVQARVAAVNNDPNNKAVAAGWKVELVADAEGTLKAEWKRPQFLEERTVAVTFPEGDEVGAVVGMASPLSQASGPRFMGRDTEENMAALNKELTSLNLYTNGLATAHKVRETPLPENTKIGLADVIAKGINETGGVGPLTPQEQFNKDNQGNLRRRRPEVQELLPPVDEDHVGLALRDSEKSWSVAGQKDSGKGTLGPYQLTEGAVKDIIGPAYDKDKLDWYRTDEKMSKKIAVGYYRRLLKEYGDPLKAAAAYNWGGGNRERKGVRDAVTWANKTGKDWTQYPSMPAETRNYITTFRKSYGSYYPGERDLKTGAAIGQTE
jgi:hypothetical protein